MNIKIKKTDVFNPSAALPSEFHTWNLRNFQDETSGETVTRGCLDGGGDLWLLMCLFVG